jgi:tRNA nucleotidyltransferase (CCA-adding enzyme)
VVTRLPCEEEVLRRIRPREEERARLENVAERLVAAIDREGPARGMVVGSVARSTWLSGDRDLDIFLLFDPSLTQEDLKEQGLALARRIATRYASSYHEKYAEHPYINATVDGLDVDLVPCFAVESAARIKSAVDRTPFHNVYIATRISDLVDDVLLLKQFTKGAGVYGSDQMTEGFSGYLCELLVLHHGGFSPLVEAVAEWRPGTCIDLAGHACRAFEEPLRVVDPVDPARNVAAALSLTRMCEFVEWCRGYREMPSAAFFFPPEQEPFTRGEFTARLEERGTRLIALSFATPPLIPDIVVPQLRRSLEALCGLLTRGGFVVHQADALMGDQHSLILFELLVDTVPPVVRHTGPPVWDVENAAKFTEKYRTNRLSGPFIVDGRYHVELQRKYTDAGAHLRSPEVLSVGLGKHVKREMEKGWEVCEGEDCYRDEWAGFLTRFIEPASPLARMGRQGAGDTSGK